MAPASPSYPGYLALHERGELRERVRLARGRLTACDMCPHRCGVDRLSGQRGVCGIGAQAVVAGYEPHFGEEACLVGRGGSGAIFFAGCPLSCRFCQTAAISQGRSGSPMTAEELAAVMLELQAEDCANINLVSGGHVTVQVLAALEIACTRGLRLPLVLNSSGYERLETLRLLEGVVDIYLPDFKLWDEDLAERLLGAADYPAAARSALTEMQRQVGPLTLDEHGLARRGLLVRHLVLPGGLANTAEIMAWIARELSPDTWLSIIGNYRPCGLPLPPPLERTLHAAEYEEALAAAQAAGIRLHHASGS